MDDPYTVHTNTIGYAYFPPPTTNVPYIAPAYYIIRAPQRADQTVYLAYTYNFGVMIETKRVSIPPGIIFGGTDTSLILFDGRLGTPGTSLGSDSTLIRGEYLANDPYPTGVTVNSIIGLYNQSGVLHVKDIILVGASGSNRNSYYSYYSNNTTTNINELYIYGYSASNVKDSGINAKSFVSPLPLYYDPAIE